MIDSRIALATILPLACPTLAFKGISLGTCLHQPDLVGTSHDRKGDP
jgi:hypothetical protein